MALEFVIEVMLANQLAAMPEELSAACKRDMTEHPPYAPLHPVDVALLEAIQKGMRSSLENLLRKVSERETDIRHQLDEALH